MATIQRYSIVTRAVIVYGRHLLLARETAGGFAISPGRWHLPGGEVLSGETPQKAIERLIKLKTGLVVEARGCVDALTRRGIDPRTGKPGLVLHLFFLCHPVAETDPGLLPGGHRNPPLDGTAILGEPAATLAGPPGGSAWGWADIRSGLAALRYDAVGPAVVAYLETIAGPPAN